MISFELIKDQICNTVIQKAAPHTHLLSVGSYKEWNTKISTEWISLAATRLVTLVLVAWFSKYLSCSRLSWLTGPLSPILMADACIVPGPGLSLVTSPTPWTLSSWSLSYPSTFLLYLPPYKNIKPRASDSLLFTRLLSVPIIMDIPGLRMINARVIVALWSWQCRQHGVTHF